MGDMIRCLAAAALVFGGCLADGEVQEGNGDLDAAHKARLEKARATVSPSSTGVIGWRLPVDAMVGAVPQAASALACGSVMPAA